MFKEDTEKKLVYRSFLFKLWEPRSCALQVQLQWAFALSKSCSKSSPKYRYSQPSQYWIQTTPRNGEQIQYDKYRDLLWLFQCLEARNILISLYDLNDLFISFMLFSVIPKVGRDRNKSISANHFIDFPL